MLQSTCDNWEAKVLFLVNLYFELNKSIVATQGPLLACVQKAIHHIGRYTTEVKSSHKAVQLVGYGEGHLQGELQPFAPLAKMVVCVWSSCV